jgi:predicted ATPase
MPKNPYSGSTFQSAHADRKFFVGRKAELQELRGFIAEMSSGSSKTRIVNVFGSAGTGKSSLLSKLRDDIDEERRFHSVLFNIDADTFDPEFKQ